ncbi:MAG: hypothetical protein AB1705_20905 [Verrucomicrobiota bacterium]
MAYHLGVTVQVAERGQIYTSEDLSFWQPRVSGTTNSLRAVTFFGDRLVITGERGTVLYADSLEDFQLVPLPTADWLEGVAASTTTIVAVGDNCAIYTSSDGAAWSRENPPTGSTNWLRGVAFGGSIFVAVGERGFIATANTTGKTWTKRTSGVSTHLNRVAYINGKFWVVGDSGVLLCGNGTGTTWTPITSLSTTNHLYTVAGVTNTILVGGEKELQLSENFGTNWSNELSASKSLPARNWTYLSSVWEDTLFLTAGRTGNIFEGFKTNSAGDYLWVERNESIRTWLWDVHRAPEFYVAVGDYATVMTSSRGVNWELELVPDAVTNSILLGVGGSASGLVAVGNRGSLIFSPDIITNVVFTNLDNTTVTNPVSLMGTLWQAMSPPTTNDLQGVTYGAGKYVVTGGNGAILTSTDGTNWSPAVNLSTKFLSSVEHFPGGYVATGDGGTILGSLDGSAWTARVSGTTNWIYRVRYLNNLLIAVGENGAILTSTDGLGLLWAPQTSGTTKWLNDVEFIEGTWYVIGNQGTVLVSTNAIDWTDIGTLTQKSLFGLAANSGQVLAVGIEGAIVRSQLTPINDPIEFLEIGRAAQQITLLISGFTDQRFTLMRGTNLVDWEDGVTLEFLDRSGTLLYLDNVDTNNLPREFFRGRIAP